MNNFKCLGDVATFTNGYAFKPADWGNEGLPIIRIQNLTSNNQNFNYYNKNYDPKYEINKGDILISWSASLGVYEWQGEKALLNQHIFKVTFNKIDIDKKFFIYAIRVLLKNIEHRLHGSTMKHITKPMFENLKIFVPSLEKQREIAKILEKIFYILGQKKQQLSELDRLVKFQFLKMFGDPILNEKNYEKKLFSECCIINPKKNEIKLEEEYSLSFISMADVSEKGNIETNNIKIYKEVKNGFTYFREKDVLFAKITPCMENGKGGIVKGLHNGIGFGSTEFHVLRPIENISNSYWLYYLTMLPFFRKNAEKNMTGSAGQKRVPLTYFQKIFVALPPIELQNKFAEFVKQVDKSKVIFEKALKILDFGLNYFNVL